MKNKKALPFNKKNTELFAKSLYKEDRNTIICKKLCSKLLQDKNGLHCALGEALVWFVDSNFNLSSLKKEAALETKKLRSRITQFFKNDKEAYNYYDKEFCAFYFNSNENVDVNDIVIKKLLDIAVIKNSRNKVRLREKLYDSIYINDNCEHDYVYRAYEVQKHWLKNIATLLK